MISASAHLSFPRNDSMLSLEDETEVDLTLPELDTPTSNYAALTLASGRVLEVHGVGVLAALIKGPSSAQEPSFILRNPDGSIEHSGALDVEAP